MQCALNQSLLLLVRASNRHVRIFPCQIWAGGCKSHFNNIYCFRLKLSIRHRQYACAIKGVVTRLLVPLRAQIRCGPWLLVRVCACARVEGVKLCCGGGGGAESSWSADWADLVVSGGQEAVLGGAQWSSDSQLDLTRDKPTSPARRNLSLPFSLSPALSLLLSLSLPLSPSFPQFPLILGG